MKVIAGGATLNVLVNTQLFVIDVERRGRQRKWRWFAERDAYGALTVGRGRAKTWADAYRAALRACEAAAYAGRKKRGGKRG